MTQNILNRHICEKISYPNHLYIILIFIAYVMWFTTLQEKYKYRINFPRHIENVLVVNFAIEPRRQSVWDLSNLEISLKSI